MLATLVLSIGYFPLTPSANSVGSDQHASINVETELSNPDQNLGEASEKLQKHFKFTDDRVVLDTSAETLSQELGITIEDAKLMIEVTNEINLFAPQPRGFVGVYINLGPKVRKMNGWAAAAFVGGYVGWYAKNFAAGGPVGAGVAALITGGAAVATKWAVSNGIRRISLGKYIPKMSWNYNINIP